LTSVKKAGRAIELQPFRIEPRDEARRPIREARDLLLPFRFDRSGGDDKHALDALRPRQNFAGGDGLDGLAEAHLVGQERALVKG